MSDFVIVPLNKLKLSDRNMRQGDTKDPETGVGAVYIGDLLGDFRGRQKDDIVLQNLRVTEERKGKKATGFYLVHVGGRRWRTLNYMASKGEISEDAGIPCRICRDEALALQESVAENQARLPPEPAQVYRAFKSLADEGKSAAQIAERFDISELVVKRRLSLGSVSPRLFELFERNEIELEQMYALTLSDDHAVQEAAWDEGVQTRMTSPHHIRQRITKEEQSIAHCEPFKFIGEDAYLAAGGYIRRDLFSDREGSGYINDVALVNRLALEKLEAAAAPHREAGWAWVETRLTFGWQEKERYEQVYAQVVGLSQEDEAEIDRLTAEAEGLDEEDYDGQDEIESQIQAIQAKAGRAFSAEQKAVAGVMVTLSYGKIEVIEGLVRPDDRKALRALAKSTNNGASAVASSSGNKREDGLSAGQVSNLTAHRTLAMQAHLMTRPDVAFLAMVHRMLLLAFYTERNYYSASTPSSALVLSGRDRNHEILKYADDAGDLKTSRAQMEIDARKAEVRAQLPVKEGLWEFLGRQTQEKLMELLAVATAEQLYLVETYSALGFRGTTGDDIARAAEFDMSKYWVPTSEWLSKIKKDQILKAMKEAGDVEITPALEKAKRSELAVRAAAALDGKGWVPEIIRTPDAVPLTDEQRALLVAADASDEEIDADYEYDEDEGSEFEDEDLDRAA